ncbi:trypsin-like serine protease [Pseudobacteriovorax antillogorgiicola]|uniref:Trypsin n=1 Tax=Pseudobacteriovorax antillogorgiicola TaxID=1513793 RepID=A0A1Y6CR99_9BACT|nr:trypsin-like serine protease [Pseudobacteriovorax antillogorgiicola]TCS45869.1 trypsin [Pseudobacteriovorax antillogorgiicola]SMF71295.1 Trypsin [Pseudobacteriovorax antillogorgiicola]
MIKSFLKASFVLFAIQPLSSCSNENSKATSKIDIFKGEDVNPEDYSPVARLDRSLCSAVAIADDLFLTAAHCVSTCVGLTIGQQINSDIQCELQADLSEMTVSGAGGTYQVVNVQFPERVKMRNNITLAGFDLALIQVDRTYEGGFWAYAKKGDSTIDTLLKANQGRFRSQLGSLEALGYGSNGRQGSIGQLRRGMMSFRGFYSFNDEEIHIGALQAHHACAGDSGGPAIVQTEDGPVVVGISSRLFNLDYPSICAVTDGSLYTNLMSPIVSDWLEQAISKI